MYGSFGSLSIQVFRLRRRHPSRRRRKPIIVFDGIVGCIDCHHPSAVEIFFCFPHRVCCDVKGEKGVLFGPLKWLIACRICRHGRKERVDTSTLCKVLSLSGQI